MEIQHAIDILEKRSEGNFQKAAEAALTEYANQYRAGTKSQLRTKLWNAISNALELREITNEDNDALLDQVADIELVHKLKGGATELKENRLAHQRENLQAEKKIKSTENKHCFGLFFPGNPKPAAVVYTEFMHLPENEQGQVNYANLPGDITKVRDEAGDYVKKPNTIIFYSVSNPNFDEPKNTWLPELAGIPTGDLVIAKVADHIKKLEYAADFKFKAYSTLSPLRSFSKWLSEQKNMRIEGYESDISEIARSLNKQFKGSVSFILDVLADNEVDAKGLINRLSEEEKKTVSGAIEELAVKYLLEVRKDPVEQFHMGHGAVIGGVRVNLNPAAGQDKVMVNYVRSVGNTEERGAKFKKGEVQIARYIIDDIAKHTGSIERLGALTSHLKDIDNEIVAYQGGK